MKIGRGDGVRLKKKKKKKKKRKAMPGEMGAFGNKHLLEMERVVRAISILGFVKCCTLLYWFSMNT